jgi:hypothetical protein
MKMLAGGAVRQTRGGRHAIWLGLEAHSYAAGQGGHANIRALLARMTRAVESKFAVGEM